MDLAQIDLFPTQPGVYIMRDRNGRVLYVGKAKNLRQRVKQYFALGRDGRPMVPYLVVKVASIDTIIVSSEKEALLLENNLIKNYQPSYNALLKDDKTYVSLKITTQHPWPMVLLVRYKGRPPNDGLYFGPYTSAVAARNTFDLLNKLFPLRQCSDQELARRTRPCILYQMKRCVAPCVGLCTKEEYHQLVQNVIQFLRGQDKELIRALYAEMEQAAAALEFERAEEILKVVRSIEVTLEKQNVDKVVGNDTDVWAVFRQAEEVILTLMAYRHGKLVASENHSFSGIAQDDQELLHSFLLQHYQMMEQVPHEILVPIPLPDATALEEILAAISERNVSVHCPQRGEKCRLVEMAYANAESAFRRSKDERAIREKTLLEMQDKLRLTRYPKRIECFDNSHLSGSQAVSALVTFVEGEKETKGYRTYRLRDVKEGDDYGAMREVLIRRYGKAKEENHLPDLLIIDGGKAHLNVAI
jgi:excinuclease ABC subunit C